MFNSHKIITVNLKSSLYYGKKTDQTRQKEIVPNGR